jgi:N-acetylmuramoyl-L-alanine amidase
MTPASTALALAALLATAGAEDTFVDAKRTYAALRADKARRTQRVPYEKLVRQLTACARAKAARADDCQYFAATVAEDLYVASGVAADLDAAVKLNVDVADDFPRSSLADDALLRAARLLMGRRGDMEGARALLLRARKDHAHGDQVRAVAELLARLPPPAPKEEARRPPPPPPSVATRKTADKPDRAQKSPAADGASKVAQGEERTDGADARSVEEILNRFAAAAEDAGVSIKASPTQAGAMTEVDHHHDAPAPPTEVEHAVPEVVTTQSQALPLGLVSTRSRKKDSQFTLSTQGPVVLQEGTAVAAGKLPARYFVDITPAKVGSAGKGLKGFQDKRVKAVRVAQYDARTVRVVVELVGNVPGNAVYDSATHQVLVRLGEFAAAPDTPTSRPPPPLTASAQAQRDEAAVQAALTEADGVDAGVADAGIMVMNGPDALKLAHAAPDAGPSLKEVKTLARELKSPSVSLSAQAGLKVRRVVIDAGHGGEDPGAIGPTGVKEKDITLKLARRVAEKLRKDLKMEVILTRDKDVYLPLEQRTAIANAAHADLFISIHCNSSPNRRIYGVETYYLNITDDKYAIRLAARENRESEKSIGDLEFILADLAMKSNVDDSARLSKLVQANVVGELREKYTSVKDLGVKHALFYVLIGAKMPAILVETSFVSNKQEEARLNDPRYQDNLADGLVQGIRDFVEERQALAR